MYKEKCHCVSIEETQDKEWDGSTYSSSGLIKYINQMFPLRYVIHC